MLPSIRQSSSGTLLNKAWKSWFLFAFAKTEEPATLPGALGIASVELLSVSSEDCRDFILLAKCCMVELSLNSLIKFEVILEALDRDLLLVFLGESSKLPTGAVEDDCGKGPGGGGLELSKFGVVGLLLF
jgi:hypothetical protein